jgi:GDP-mannose 6-dehydrogenase
VRVYDPTVVLSSLKGANRRYIETEIPHIASLLCDNVEALITHAEVLVFGTTGKEAARVMAAVTDGQTIVDLTHGGLAKHVEQEAELAVVEVRR